MKKFLSVLLSLIMILSLVPMTTMASDVITSVDIINVLTPVAGTKWEWQWDKSSMVYKDSGYTVYQQPEWYDETEQRYMNHNETFQAGHIYTVQVWAEVKDGYEFDSTAADYNMKATINGKEAKLSKAFEYQRWAMAVVSYTFPEVKNNKIITEVSVQDIKEPKIGIQSIAREHYLRNSEGVTGYISIMTEASVICLRRATLYHMCFVKVDSSIFCENLHCSTLTRENGEYTFFIF